MRQFQMDRSRFDVASIATRLSSASQRRELQKKLISTNSATVPTTMNITYCRKLAGLHARAALSPSE